MTGAADLSGGRGRLAQLVASRGGKAAPEAPFVIEHREALIYMLCEAAELEHGILCQYLFAAFSLKGSVDEGLTEGELAATTRWRRVVSHCSASATASRLSSPSTSGATTTPSNTQRPFSSDCKKARCPATAHGRRRRSRPSGAGPRPAWTLSECAAAVRVQSGHPSAGRRSGLVPQTR